jgi:catechol 2,3-dioxygenase-like lactoylglutathione lyase family enzyme
MPEGRISIISVPVRDPERSKAFYVEKFGFDVMSDVQVETGERWVILKPTGSEAAITLVTWFKSMKPGSIKGLVLAVESIERAIADMRRRGMPITSETIQEAPWGRWISVEDPDGNGWIVQQDILMETKPEAPPE